MRFYHNGNCTAGIPLKTGIFITLSAIIAGFIPIMGEYEYGKRQYGKERYDEGYDRGTKRTKENILQGIDYDRGKRIISMVKSIDDATERSRDAKLRAYFEQNKI